MSLSGLHRISYASPLSVLLVVGGLLMLNACNIKADEPQVVPQGDVGPFEVAFTPESTYTHAIDVTIRQDAGKLEYYLPPAAETAVEVVDLKTEVEGCPVDQVKVEWLYLSDTTSSLGVVLRTGSVLRTVAQQRSVIVAQYQNLTNCSVIRQQISLKRIPLLMETKQQGLWETTQVAGTSVNRLSLKFTEWGPRDLRVVYNAACEDNESFEGRVVASDLTTTPRRFTLEISRVTKSANRFCPNLLFFSDSAAGQKVACLFEKSLSDPSFKLACNRPSINPVYPAGFESAEVQWSKQ